nr:ATP synthase F0 subunit 8 [Systasis sp. 1 HHL-2023a]
MPQMSPLLWLILFFYFILSFYLILVMIYYFFLYLEFNNLNKNIIKKFNFILKW